MNDPLALIVHIATPEGEYLEPLVPTDYTLDFRTLQQMVNSVGLVYRGAEFVPIKDLK
jgi:hypothetical protein